jgi:ribosomal protein S18 acetylase RimI-like enzyme
MAQQKSAHRGGIWGVYVHPEARRKGVDRAVLETVIAHARERVLQVHLSVSTGSAALRLYRQLGFEIYGTEPRALCVDNRYLDEHLMVLRLDA